VCSLDGIDVARNPADHRRRVARTGADLQHTVTRPNLGRLDHQAHNVGLRYGLACLDRQGRVLIGEFLQALWHEDLARDLAHGLQHKAVADAAARELPIHHPFAVRR
jgi:hypothetical protein